MANNTKVTLNKGGTQEKTLLISKIQVPDLWHLAQTQKGEIKKLILDCWGLANDLKRHIQES